MMNHPNELVEDKKVLELAEAHAGEAGGLLPTLHAIQDAFGYIPERALPVIARAQNLSRAEVYGVVTYYHYFRLTPPARHVVHVCRAEACQARGADRLVAFAEQYLGCSLHGTSGAGDITLEPVYCLGQCAIGPSVAVNETTLHGRVDEAKFEALIKDLRNQKGDGQ